MTVKLLPHNEETYQRMIGMFETDDRVAVVQPTGTGKSFLMLKWIEDNPYDDILIISPSNAIFKQLDRYARASGLMLSYVNMYTFAKLNLADPKWISSLKADKIILDEFHRSGGESWGESLDILLSSHTNAKILGLTATPVRYLDRSRDMGIELFNDNFATYMTLGEAIERGILPVPKYVPVWYDYDERLTRYQQDINNLKTQKERDEAERLLRLLKRNLQNAYGPDIIFKYNMRDDHGKYIVFCRNIEHIPVMKRKMKQWLKDINHNVHCYITHSDRNDKDKQVEKFIDDNDDTAIKLLFAVDRLNEGVHVQGIDGVIMLRPTRSGIIYLQQMGRAFASGGNQPIIFDMVNNYQNVKVQDPDGNYENIFEKQIYGSALVRKTNADNLIFTIFEDMKKFNEIFDHIERILYPDHNQVWERNFQFLKTYFQESGEFPSITTELNGFYLGRWFHNQKALYNNDNLPKDRQEKLESLGVDLYTRDADEIWEQRFQFLKMYIEENGKLPSQNENTEILGEPILRWFYSQKSYYSKGHLPKDRQEKLESLGVDLYTRDADEIWEQRFQFLKMYIEENGKLPSRVKGDDGQNLAYWIYKQKIHYSKGTLPKDRQEKLESLGIDLLIEDKNIIWESKFELLKAYIEETGKMPGINTIIEGVQLYNWIRNQRISYSKGTLPKDRQEKLESLGINLIKRNNSELWEQKFQILKIYVEENGKLPTNNNEFQGVLIYTWLTAQKTFYSKGRLSKDRQEKLESLGVVFKKKKNKE